MTIYFLLPAFLLASLAVAQAPAVPTHLSLSGIEGPSPRVAWTLAAPAGAVRGIQQTAYELRFATSAAALRAGKADLWDSGRVAASVLQAEYAGKPLPPGAVVAWQVRTWETWRGHAAEAVSAWSEPANFSTPLATWSAKWIAAGTDADPKPLPIFRRTVTLAARPVSAMLFVSGLGQYEARVNGKPVTRDVITPGWTDYRRRILYDSYDVLPLLRPGKNALGVLLGNGMYNVVDTPGRYIKFSASMGVPKLLLELHLRFADGREQLVRSDEQWRTAPGPITFSNTFGGEDFDARREPAGWDTASFDDTTWKPVTLTSSPGGMLTPEQTPPVRPLDHHATVATTHPAPGVTVYDLGQNFAGWPTLSVKGPAGAKVTMLPGELLDAKGRVTQRSANAFPKDPASFAYTLRGDTAAQESWHPRFSYYGFRYVEVQTTDPAVRIVSVGGEETHADAAQIGTFTSSSDLFNRIHTIILHAVRSNMVSVLTDCPHREKLGWLEQTHLFAGSLMVNYDVAALYQKLSDDMADAQLANGLVPSIAPEYIQFVDKNGESNDFRDSPEWGSAVVLSPWAAFQAYGDPTPLREHYSSMQRYVAFLQGKAKNHLLSYGLGDWYDIGPKEPGYSQLTSKTLTATAVLYQDLVAMEGIARLLGKAEDEASYSRDATTVRDAFNQALFHTDTAQYDKGSQTANAMPLALGLVPEGQRDAVLANLVHEIEQHGYHVTAGDVGFHYVVRALTDAGRSDVVTKMLSLDTSPSYGYQLTRGATTLTEAWDTNPNSSQNHFMLGHGEEWFYRGLAGIELDMSRTAADRIRIHPYIPQEGPPLNDAGASIDTPLGKVVSHWKKTANAVALEVTVPPNATARLTLPAGYSQWTESGKPLVAAEGVEQSGGGLTLESGTYHFTGKLQIR